MPLYTARKAYEDHLKLLKVMGTSRDLHVLHRINGEELIFSSEYSCITTTPQLQNNHFQETRGNCLPPPHVGTQTLCRSSATERAKIHPSLTETLPISPASKIHVSLIIVSSSQRTVEYS